MPRIALVVPSTTYRATDFVEAAARLDADVMVVSDHRQALADMMGDRAVKVSLRDSAHAADEIAARAQRLPLDAVIGVDDQGVEIAALASARLGLPHSPAEAVAATRDKQRMRTLLGADDRVRQPSWLPATTPAEARESAAALGCPVVVKPVSLSASRGVLRADDPDAAAAAAGRTLRMLDEAREPRRLLVERFVPGVEVALEGLVDGGVLRTLALFDKPDPLDGPVFEETLYVTPSRLPEATQEAVRDAAARSVAALGLAEGPVHAEFRVGGGEVTVLELAARTIGGLCGRALRFGLGMRLEEVVLRHALGLPLHALAREDAASGVLMLPVPHAGVLRAVDGVDRAAGLPGVDGVEITVAAGQRVRPLPEGDRYLGFAFAHGRGPAEVEATLRTVHATLEPRIEEDDGTPSGDEPGTGSRDHACASG